MPKIRRNPASYTEVEQQERRKAGEAFIASLLDEPGGEETEPTTPDESEPKP